MAKQKTKVVLPVTATAPDNVALWNVPVPDEDKVRHTHNTISKKDTHPFYIQQRSGPGGKMMDFVDEGYMRQVLNDNFPIWNWEVISYEIFGPPQMPDYVCVHGRLTINDNGAERYFDALAANQVKYMRDTSVTVDLGNDMKSANTQAFKLACNRLCNISDDVYRKSVLSDEQLDTIEGMIGELDMATKKRVMESIGDHKINPGTFSNTVEKLNKLTKGENNG